MISSSSSFASSMPATSCEGDLVLVLGEQLGAALAEGHRLAAADLHLAHEEDPDADEQQHREPLDQEDHVPGLAVLGLGRDLDALVAQQLDQVRVLRREGLEALAVEVVPADVLPLDRDLLDVALLDRREELAEDDLRIACLLAIQQVEEQQHHQPKDQPQRDVAGYLVQLSSAVPNS